MHRPKAVVIALMVAACTDRPLPPPRVVSAPIAQADRAPVADAAVAEAVVEPPVADPPAPPSSWSDPLAVDALAQSCAYAPPSTVDGEGDGPDAMLCTAGLDEQSCSYDPCFGNDCRHRCGDACARCDTGCRDTCGACRATCRDAACVRACAAATGRCLEGCLGARDRCTTAVCTAEYEDCAYRDALRFRRGPCLAACGRCYRGCEAQEFAMECTTRCLARQRGCTPEQRQACVWNGPEYGADVIARRRDAGVAAPADASP
jgi:hypothetical protein